MSERNSERMLVRVVREAAAELGVRVESFGEGWVLRLTRAGTVRHVHGYCFDLNPAATSAIACDKAATSEALESAGIARIEHRLFLHPDMARFVRHPGNWPGMLAFFEACGRDVVVKDNMGTGGRGVFRARTLVDLEGAVLGLFSRGHAVAMCPFVDIEEESRFVLLRGRCEAAYVKERPTVTGDGTRTVLELLAAQVAAHGLTAELSRLLANMDPETAVGLREVPRQGESRLLNWRHNLGQGAAVRMVDAKAPGVGVRLALAMQAAAALNLQFGSVDIVTVGGRPAVLEVNAGVMMEALAAAPDGRTLAEGVYRRAVAAMFTPA